MRKFYFYTLCFGVCLLGVLTVFTMRGRKKLPSEPSPISPPQEMAEEVELMKGEFFSDDLAPQDDPEPVREDWIGGLGSKAGRFSPEIRLIIGVGEQLDYLPRSRAVHRLSRRLSADEYIALCAFLRSYVDQQRLPLMEFNALKNDILDALIAQEKLPSDLEGLFETLYTDPYMDPMFRDYVLQRLSLYAERVWGEPPLASFEHQDFIVPFYKRALEDRSGSLAGTALIGMDRLHRRYGFPGEEMIREAVLQVSSDPDCSSLSMLPAFRLAGIYGVEEVLPALRRVLKSNPGTPLTLAIVKTLGEIGSEEDFAYLKTLSEHDVSSVQVSALQAFALIEGRRSGQ